MKKFEKKDILINRIKTYPKVKLFTYEGKIYYNNSEEGTIKLNDFLNVDLEAIQAANSTTPTFIILTEDSEFLHTENGENILLE